MEKKEYFLSGIFQFFVGHDYYRFNCQYIVLRVGYETIYTCVKLAQKILNNMLFQKLKDKKFVCTIFPQIAYALE